MGMPLQDTFTAMFQATTTTKHNTEITENVLPVKLLIKNQIIN